MKPETLDRAARIAEREVAKLDSKSDLWDYAQGYLPSEYKKWPKFLRRAIQDEAQAQIDSWEVQETERILSLPCNFVRVR